MDINEILKGVKCEACGKEHKCPIENVYIEKNAANRLTEIAAKYNKVLLVADENTYGAAGEKVENALSEVSRKGYGIVTPTIDELSLEEPEIVKQGNRFGVRLRASAPSIHIMCNKPEFLKIA